MNKIKKITTFWTKANILKTKKENNKYTVAENIFSTIILAIAINSEFNETKNISEIIKALILEEIFKEYPNYNWSYLNIDKDYLNRFKNTKEYQLLLKYKKLNKRLTSLIDTKENLLSYDELQEEGIKIINELYSNNKEQTKEIFKFYYLNHTLKKKERTGWDKNHWNVLTNKREKIADHIIGTISLAIIISKQYNHDIDINKIIEMLSLHETGETIIGDITPFDGITPKEKEKREHDGMSKALGNLKEKEKFLKMLFEFDKRETKESRFTYLIDKIEADMQAKLYQEKDYIPPLKEQENNPTLRNNKVRNMLTNGATTPFDIWYLWDLDRFTKEQELTEFLEILNYIKENELTKLLNEPTREIINLSDKEQLSLTNSITILLRELYSDNNIDSAYMISYHNNNNNNQIEIVILTNSKQNIEYYKNLITTFNAKIKSLNNTNIDITFTLDNKEKYTIIDLNPSELDRTERLIEASILFDKSGDITNLKEAKEKGYTHLNQLNLIKFVPPIDKSIKLQLTKN